MGRAGRAKEHSVGSGGAGDESGVVSVMGGRRRKVCKTSRKIEQQKD